MDFVSGHKQINWKRWIKLMEFGCHHFCLTRFQLELSIFFWTSSQLAVQFWHCMLLHWWEFLWFVEVVYCVCIHIEPCLLPAIQVCSIAYHSVVQQGFHGTSAFREWLPEVQPEHKNKIEMRHFCSSGFISKSRIDTEIIG